MKLAPVKTSLDKRATELTMATRPIKSSPSSNVLSDGVFLLYGRVLHAGIAGICVDFELSGEELHIFVDRRELEILGDG